MTTTLSISKRARDAGQAMAVADRRSLSKQIELLIMEEHARRQVLKQALLARGGAAVKKTAIRRAKA